MIDQTFSTDLKEALLTGNARKVSTLRMVKAMLKNAQVARGHPLSEGETLEVLSSACKMRRDSIEAFQKGKRPDLVRQEEEELAIIESYLPPRLTDQELQVEVDTAILETEATCLRDLGKVMAVLMPRVRGRTDGSSVPDLVRKTLGC